MLRKHTTQSTTAHQTDRRQFLKLGTCGAVTNTALFSGLLNSHPSAASAAPEIPTSGYKALVCIFLPGGFDGFQVLAPFGDTPGDTDYADYATSRTTLSYQREDPANPGNPGGGWDTTGGGQVSGTTYGYLQQISDSATGKKFGLHPRFTLLKQLYTEGKATFCANVGTLIEPIADRTQYSLSTTKKPFGLFSHTEMLRHCQTAVPSTLNELKGWGGKMADFLTDPLVESPTRFYSAISTLGSNIWQTGNRIRPYTITPPTTNSIGGAVVLTGYAANGSTEYNGLDDFSKAYSDIQNDLINQLPTDLLEKSILKIRTEARDAAEMYQGAIAFQNGVSGTPLTLPTTMLGPGGVGTVATQPFDTFGLGAQLAGVARAIKQRSLLGYAGGGRQIFMVQVGGWDHNVNAIPNMNNMIPGLDRGLKSFHDFLNAEGLINDVTTFTMSEFGRTISSNGLGSDNGYGNNMIVMGGALNQGTGRAPRIWGSYPQIKIGTAQPLDTSTRGTYIPTMSTDSFHAEMAIWFGLPNDTTAGSPLRTVFPNIANFHTGGGSSHPVGFMNF